MWNSCRVTATTIGGLLVAGLLLATTAQQADARPQYLRWWVQEYPTVAKKNEIKPVGAKNCNVCHEAGKPKAARNDYGKAIQKALAPKRNVKSKGDFDQALKDVAKAKSSTPDKTYGELLQSDELPVPPQ
jgi:hypothetical protein